MVVTDVVVRVEAPPSNMKSIPNQYAAVDCQYNYFIDQEVFVDPNGDLLTYRATLDDGITLPDWLRIMEEFHIRVHDPKQPVDEAPHSRENYANGPGELRKSLLRFGADVS